MVSSLSLYETHASFARYCHSGCTYRASIARLFRLSSTAAATNFGTGPGRLAKMGQARWSLERVVKDVWVYYLVWGAPRGAFGARGSGYAGVPSSRTPAAFLRPARFPRGPYYPSPGIGFTVYFLYFCKIGA